MRVGLIVAAAVLGLAGCAAPPIAVPDSGWRTAAGAPLSLAEVAALEQSCVPRPAAAPLDPDRPFADNPAYHPGGEGLTNAPPNGIAAAAPDAAPPLRAAVRPDAGLVAECLYRKGLVPSR